MVRRLVLLAAFILALVGACLAQDMSDDEFYRHVFEDVDPDFILDNERILSAYLKCFFGESECNVHAEMLKKSIPEVLSTVCGKCSDKQKSIFKYSLNKFVPAHPKDWDRILSIYDPSGEAWPKVKAFMES